MKGKKMSNDDVMTTVIDAVIDQIQLDIVNGDLTALEELLKRVPVQVLQSYLPEEN
jgi:hypothetical protein